MHPETLQLVMILELSKNLWPSESVTQETLDLQQERQQEEKSDEGEEESEGEESEDEESEDEESEDEGDDEDY